MAGRHGMLRTIVEGIVRILPSLPDSEGRLRTIPTTKFSSVPCLSRA
jgi:hypothetical protein